MGIEAALTQDDAIITAYRCHGFALTRGQSVHSIIAELLGTLSLLTLMCLPFYLGVCVDV